MIIMIPTTSWSPFPYWYANIQGIWWTSRHFLVKVKKKFDISSCLILLLVSARYVIPLPLLPGFSSLRCKCWNHSHHQKSHIPILIIQPHRQKSYSVETALLIIPPKSFFSWPPPPYLWSPPLFLRIDLIFKKTFSVIFGFAPGALSLIPFSSLGCITRV